MYDAKKKLFLEFNNKYLQTYEKDIDMDNILVNKDILEDFDYYKVGCI